MISAVIRLKNEAEWIERCVDSIRDIFDDIVLVTQGDQDDNTFYICESLHGVRHYHYPFESRPNGPDHHKQNYDLHNRAYFYNWAFDRARGDWVCKWDGDMIAMDNCKKHFDLAIKKNCALKFKGIDVAGDVHHLSSRPFCASEVRLYRKGKYTTGPKCEKFILKEPRAVMEVSEPLFIHTKWIKSESSITKAWPSNWREIPHFQQIWERRKPGVKHNYTLPQCLK